MKQTVGTLSRWIAGRSVLSAATLALCVTLAPSALIPSAHIARASQDAAEGAAKRGLDRLILKSGKVVEGEILEETASTIRIKVIVAGISAPTVFQKSEVLEIKRGEVMTDTPATDVRADSKSATPVQSRIGGAKKSGQEIPEGATQLYVAELKGRFGFDVSETPLKQLFADVDKVFDDIVSGVGAESGRMVVDPAVRRDHVLILKMDTQSQAAFGSIFRTEELAPIVQEEIVQKGRRVVFWVETAGGGAAFLPWVSSEIYFTSDGKLGGVGNLDDFSSGDHMVDEKLISAFLGHAEGFAIKGGYADHLPALRAMIRQQNWLAVRFEGGRPVYLTRQPTASDGDGWLILSDDGEGENEDKNALKGNDTFLLEADWAVKLGIAKGIADTNDDMAFQLGVHRNFVVLENTRGAKLLTDWVDRWTSAAEMINPQEGPGRPLGRLWREFQEIQVGGDYAQRKRERGRKISILGQVRSLVSQYSEVFDRDGAYRAQLEIQIHQLKLEAEADARAQRGG